MPTNCSLCDTAFDERTEAVECYGCQAVICDDCAHTVTVDPGDFINPPSYEWCCDECHNDDQAAAEFAEERAAENRADARAADRAYYDDLRY